MVLLSSSICTKTGKVLVARQYMEISRSRIEGLLAAFPKLMNSDDQHTFIETESVRYVYQPMEQLYMVLITTKNSNILEDLETLRLFAKVVASYCSSLSENAVLEQSFDLMFAFDEIVALGYRENVSLFSIRMFTEMDSHDERIFKLRQKAKEREVKAEMKRKAKELKDRRLSGIGSNVGSRSYSPSSSMPSHVISHQSSSSTPSYSSPTTSAASKPVKKSSGSRGMKLGGKGKSKDFVQALLEEGQVVPEEETIISPTKTTASVPEVDPNRENVHVVIEEKITLEANRDGGLESMEVKGNMQLVVSDDSVSKIRVHCTKHDGNVPFTTHPNVDKKAFAASGVIGLKKAERAFPLNSGVGVLKWRIQGSDDSQIPLTVNCWPNPNGDGSCDVNIDYELVATHVALRDVTITIPLPASSGTPVVESVEGAHEYDKRNSVLYWQIPLIDAENPEGSIEFAVSADEADDFFPVQVDFVSSTLFANISVDSVEVIGGGDTAFSTDISFTPDSFEIV